MVIAKSSQTALNYLMLHKLSVIQMAMQFTLHIKPTRLPLLRKHCSRCACNLYYCSEKFKVNSDEKNIDVWIIYRCLNCDETYNISVVSKADKYSINSYQFNKFYKNDKQTVFAYAFDSMTATKNNTFMEYGTTGYTLSGDACTCIEKIFNSNCESVEIGIACMFDIHIRLSNIMKKLIGISSGQFKEMIDNEIITVQGVDNIKGYKVGHGAIISLKKNRLESYLT